jgi:hypothetical protein
MFSLEFYINWCLVFGSNAEKVTIEQQIASKGLLR